MSNPTLSAQTSSGTDNVKATRTPSSHLSRKGRTRKIGYYVLTRTYNMYSVGDPARLRLKELIDKIKHKTDTFSWSVIYEAVSNWLGEEPDWTNEQFNDLLHMLDERKPMGKPLNKFLYEVISGYAKKYKLN